MLARFVYSRKVAACRKILIVKVRYRITLSLYLNRYIFSIDRSYLQIFIQHILRRSAGKLYISDMKRDIRENLN